MPTARILPPLWPQTARTEPCPFIQVGQGALDRCAQCALSLHSVCTVCTVCTGYTDCTGFTKYAQCAQSVHKSTVCTDCAQCTQCAQCAHWSHITIKQADCAQYFYNFQNIVYLHTFAKTRSRYSDPLPAGFKFGTQRGPRDRRSVLTRPIGRSCLMHT
jgi:hypothetical protein